MTTEAELLTLVHGRFPTMDVAMQTRIVHAALAVLREPRWVKIGLPPLAAVKIAAHRVQHRKSF